MFNSEDEVYYCGKCREQRDPKKGERCKVCGKIMVSWNIRHENESAARERWKQLNG